MDDTSQHHDLEGPPGPCPFCHDLNPKRGPGSRSKGEDPGVLVDLRVVKSRASEGCHTCEIIGRTLTLLDPEWRSKIDTPGGECRGDSVHEPLFATQPIFDCTCDMFRLVPLKVTDTILLSYPCGMFQRDVSGTGGNTIELYVKEGVPRPMGDIDVTHYHRASQGLQERLRVVLDLIDDCRHKHYGKCSESNKSVKPTTKWNTFKLGVNERFGRKSGATSTRLEEYQAATLPPRVLDLRNFTSESKLRLFETVGYQGWQDTYACLSYCWGARNSCMTTAATLAPHLDDIPWADLPQTYKDAIQVASALGLSFLWIDALCIIQGDQQDWEAHAAEMANIYGNSTLVISAVDASDVTHGFLRPPRTLADVFEIETGEITVHARRTLDHIWLDSSDSDRIGQIPLWSRGWCLQEEVLAPRVLSFYRDEFFFQCGSGYFRCECNFHPDGDFEDEGWLTTPIKLRFYNTLLTFVPTKANRHWQGVVESYSRRKLTLPSDKLPALSGMAQAIQKDYKLEYLAGHWKDDHLFESLCWIPSILQPEDHGGFTSTYIAPSWSWMSFQGSIKTTTMIFEEDTVATGTRLISYKIKPASKDPTGAILAGHLFVRGAFLDATVRYAGNNGMFIWRNNQKVFGRLDPGKVIGEDDAVVCWLLYKQQARSGRDELWIFSIILRKVNKKRCRPVYERVGVIDDAFPPTDKLKFFDGWETEMKKAYLV
ncbi:heterokaryon incompatibility protein-domain-containing protein [Cladorrhinum sp. PSN332]|nr:heterokaryon incompatibility protein-domain-containing protein [Cladorrhinum sp. PSN332]